MPDSLKPCLGRLKALVPLVALTGAGLAVVWLTVRGGGPPVHPGFTTCGVRIVASRSERRASGLATWPDGTLGVVREGGELAFVGADGSSVATSRGTLSDPLEHVESNVAIAGFRTDYDYAAGGPVYVDPTSHSWLLFYHAERWPGGDALRFYSSIGLAISRDEGRSWHDLGPIIRPNLPYGAAKGTPVEVGGAPYVTVGGYFYVYFRDYTSPGRSTGLSVARAPITSVVAAAVDRGRSVAWSDYYRGRWDQPGLGGLASPLESGNPPSRWFDVGYDSTAHRYVLVVAADDSRGVNLFIASSPDGLHWSTRDRLTSGRGESFYPTLVGTGTDPLRLGAAFYVYYTYSARYQGGARWRDAVLVRRSVVRGGHCPG